MKSIEDEKQSVRQVILIVNLGTPRSPSVGDVRHYLTEFLMDPYVIDIPFLLRFFLVRGLIVPFRSFQSACRYRLIWDEKEGFPLLSLSVKFLDKLKKLSSFPVALAMRYGKPSVEQVIRSLTDEYPDLSDVIVCPLYPQYSLSATQTAVDKVRAVVQLVSPSVKVNEVPPFYHQVPYIEILSSHLQKSLDEYGQKVDYVLFSYHGLPVRHIMKATQEMKFHCFQKKDCCFQPSIVHSRCYYAQALQMTQAIAQKIQLDEGQFSTSFQSRLGSDRWLTPDTQFVLKDLALKGVSNLAVICPSFVCDCLETLEEIAIEGRRIFRSYGGKDLFLVPCLNDMDEWVECYYRLIMDVLLKGEKSEESCLSRNI